MKKILFVASISGHITAFHLPYIEWFKEQGCEVHVASAKTKELPEYVDKFFDVPFIRSPFSLKHIDVYKKLKHIVDKEQYDLISCHTPMASVLSRLVSCSTRKKGTKVVYMAHGFHFYKGSPILNWLTFYPIEKYLTRKTDGLICINNEDYELITNKGSKKCVYHLVPGVGVESNRFKVVSNKEKISLKAKLGMSDSSFNLIYAAEFIPRKNHVFIIEAFHEYKELLIGVKCYFAGRGEHLDKMKALVDRYGLNEQICFLGFRTDIDEIYKACDVGVSSSVQEGLPINIVEEMLCGLPILASLERGHKELVKPDINGFLFDLNDKKGFIDSLLELKINKVLYSNFSVKSQEIGRDFSLENSLKELTKVYKLYL
ncbi:glycosyltransferase [Myroides odoratimimus]|uniref:glycosyltransferase n=1 Tax=Myroides odoratimimus TaxID=76832 RepID=UPI002DBDCF34|nr:glycosyltransferase [Myroides odoratimimus]MEC4086900.1 glycosyltransferase [Myroides odoratimimus]